MATKPQLEEGGFTVDLQVIEWATRDQRMNNPDLWDAFTIRFTGSIYDDPTTWSLFRCDSPLGVMELRSGLCAAEARHGDRTPI